MIDLDHPAARRLVGSVVGSLAKQLKQAIKEFDIRPEDRKATMSERKTRLLAAGIVSGVPPAAF
jgi:hypothetical protein